MLTFGENVVAKDGETVKLLHFKLVRNARFPSLIFSSSPLKKASIESKFFLEIWDKK